MNKIKKHSKNNFTQISNVIINDVNLSYKAKGIFLYLWSKPDNWVVRINDLSNNGKEGSHAIYSALQELEELGYLNRKRFYENGKVAGIDYNLFEELVDSENLNYENLNEENQAHSNKEVLIINNDSNIKEKIKKENPPPKVEEETYPQNLNIEAYQEWLAYSKEKKKTYTPIGKNKLKNKLAKKTFEEQQEMVDFSIANNYQGLFEPKEKKKPPEKFETTRQRFDKAVDKHFNKENEEQVIIQNQKQIEF